jgi:hypothetical protein
MESIFGQNLIQKYFIIRNYFPLMPLQSKSYELIKFIDDKKSDKGKSLERLIHILFDSLGYRDIRTNIRKTGSEIDVKAKHKVHNYNIICECKATTSSIDSPELAKFYGKLMKEIGNKACKHGYFFSIAGYNSTAVEWYQTLSTEGRKSFEIVNAKGIIDLLIKQGLLVSNSKLDELLKKYSSLKPQIRYVISFGYTLYIVQFLQTENDSECFIILSNNGELVNNVLARTIIKKDKTLASSVFLNSLVYSKVLMNLLTCQKKTLNDIASEVIENKRDVEAVLIDMLNAKLVEKLDDSFRIKITITSFKNIAKHFVDNSSSLDFMKSEFLLDAIEKLLRGIVTKGFKIRLENEDFQAISIICSIFPSALKYVLFSEKSFFRKIESEIERLNKPDLVDYSRIQLFYSIQNIVINDLNNTPSDYLAGKGIEGIFSDSKITLASERSFLLHLSSKGSRLIVSTAPDLVAEAGTVLVPSSPDALISSMHILLNLGCLDEVEKTFQSVMKQSKGNKLVMGRAFNGLGIAYLRKGEKERALPCFKKAEEFIPNDMTIKSNIKETSKYA